MLSSTPMLMGVAFLVAVGLVLSACTVPTPDSGCCNEDNGDLYASSIVPLPRSASPDSRIGATLCLAYGYSLAYQMALAEVIVRARLVSVTTGIEARDPVDDMREALGTPDDITYFGTLEYTFDVVEYLKGMGGDEIEGVVVANDGEIGHVRRWEAEQDALRLLDWRDKRWDGREAILFLNPAYSYFVEFPRDDRYMLGSALSYAFTVFSCPRGYTISSPEEKRWLPAASAPLGASTASGSGRFLLDYPSEFGTYEWFGQHRPAPSITLSKLKAMIEIVKGCPPPLDYSAFQDCLGPGYPWHLRNGYTSGRSLALSPYWGFG